uniref:Uncharacterized protein n=1 Tax=Peromyscus maniculatus bairdii TaxID=230844 RepID=A0A8C8URR9_PERMB
MKPLYLVLGLWVLRGCFLSGQCHRGPRRQHDPRGWPPPPPPSNPPPTPPSSTPPPTTTPPTTTQANITPNANVSITTPNDSNFIGNFLNFLQELLFLFQSG